MFIKLKPNTQVDKLWTGDIRMTIKEGLSEEILNYVSLNTIDLLVIKKGNWHDLIKLVKYKDKIKSLSIDVELPDWAVVSKLSKLKELSIGGKYKNCNIDFSKLKKLRSIKVYWNKNFNLEQAINLRSLFIINYTEKDLSFLGEIKKLEFLELYNSRKLESLKGIENLNMLRYFEANGIGKLSNVSALTLLTNLVTLSLSKCKKEYDYSFLNNLKTIKQIYLGGEMRDVKWVSNMKTLKYFSLDCKLQDGDLDFLYNMDNLELALYNNKKNYSVKLKEIQTYLENKGFDQAKLRLSRMTFE